MENGVYRSAFPRTKNIQFLQTLNLKVVVPLIPEDYPKSILDFYEGSNILLLQHGVDGNKYPFKEIDVKDIMDTLIDVINPNNHPLLIHCNKGKHRTGTIVGCLRKIRGWALSAIFSEYLMFSMPKSRYEDQFCIELFDVKEFWIYIRNIDTSRKVDTTFLYLVNDAQKAEELNV